MSKLPAAIDLAFTALYQCANNDNTSTSPWYALRCGTLCVRGYQLVHFLIVILPPFHSWKWITLSRTSKPPELASQHTLKSVLLSTNAIETLLSHLLESHWRSSQTSWSSPSPPTNGLI